MQSCHVRKEIARPYRTPLAKKSRKFKHTLMRENMHSDYFENALYVSAHLENNGSNYSLELSIGPAVNQ
jgi:hypothetical protein